MTAKSDRIPRFCTVFVPRNANLLLVSTYYIRGGEVRHPLPDTNRKVLTTNQHLFLLPEPARKQQKTKRKRGMLRTIGGVPIPLLKVGDRAKPKAVYCTISIGSQS